jgi:DNA-binding transcriptional ArsR family regulator
MVLEEEIYFLSQDTARDFQKLMKSLEIPAQIRLKTSLEIRLVLSGKYPDLVSMLEEITGDESISEEDSDNCLEARDHLSAQRDVITRAFEKYQVGDRIGSSLIDIATGDRTLEGDETENELDTIIEEIFLTRLLHQNDLLDIEDSGVTLARKIEPDQVTFSISAERIPITDNTILEKHTVVSTLTAGDDEEWMVTVGPEIIFLDDLSEVDDFFTEYEGEDSNLNFLTRVHIKQILVSEILGMIREKGNSSREDIIEELSERDIESKEEGANITLHLSRTYISAVLDDLKKTGVIRGKDQKLRIFA